MQWSVRINEAYQRLKDPLRRAAYLCDFMALLSTREQHRDAGRVPDAANGLARSLEDAPAPLIWINSARRS